MARVCLTANLRKNCNNRHDSCGRDSIRGFPFDCKTHDYEIMICTYGMHEIALLCESSLYFEPAHSQTCPDYHVSGWLDAETLMLPRCSLLLRATLNINIAKQSFVCVSSLSRVIAREAWNQEVNSWSNFVIPRCYIVIPTSDIIIC